MNWLDWLILAVVGLSAVQGLRRGLVLTLTRLISLVGAIVAALVLTRPVVTFLETRFGLVTSFSQAVAGWVRLPADFAATKVSELSAGQLVALLERSGLPEPYQEAVVAWIAETPGQVALSLDRFIHQGLALLLANAVAFLVLLVLARCVIGLFGRTLSGALHSLGAGSLDYLGGLALGAAQAALILGLLLGLSQPWLAAGAPQALQEAVTGSRLAGPLLEGFHLISPWLRQVGAAVWQRLN